MSGPIVSYAWKFNSATADRPDTNYGTTVTIGASNIKGSTAQVLSSAQMSDDAYFLEIFLHKGDISAAAVAQLIDIMVDPAGGTAWSPLINNLLYVAGNGITLLGQSCQYVFPLFIKSGSSIGVRGQRATAATVSVEAVITVCGRPNDASNCPVGSRVVTYGASTSNTRGTAVTPGTTSEGAWTQLGTVAAGDAPWFWQVGAASSDATAGGVMYAFDLGIGDATNKVVVIEDQLLTISSSEQATVVRRFDGGYYQARPGDGIYGRMQCSGTADTDMTMIAYGLI